MATITHKSMHPVLDSGTAEDITEHISNEGDQIELLNVIVANVGTGTPDVQLFWRNAAGTVTSPVSPVMTLAADEVATFAFEYNKAEPMCDVVDEKFQAKILSFSAGMEVHIHSRFRHLETFSEPPAAPTMLSATSTWYGEVELTWTASVTTGVVGYDVYVSNSIGGPYALLAQTTGVVYTHEGTTPETDYSYVVRARLGNGIQSVNSTQDNVTTPADDAPAAPANLEVNSMTTEAAVLSWDPVDEPDIDHYQLWHSLTMGGPYTAYGSAVIHPNISTFYTVIGDHYVVVRAYDVEDNESANSNEVLVSLVGGPP